MRHRGACQLLHQCVGCWITAPGLDIPWLRHRLIAVAGSESAAESASRPNASERSIAVSGPASWMRAEPCFRPAGLMAVAAAAPDALLAAAPPPPRMSRALSGVTYPIRDQPNTPPVRS